MLIDDVDLNVLSQHHDRLRSIRSFPLFSMEAVLSQPAAQRALGDTAERSRRKNTAMAQRRQAPPAILLCGERNYNLALVLMEEWHYA